MVWGKVAGYIVLTNRDGSIFFSDGQLRSVKHINNTRFISAGGNYEMFKAADIV